MNPLAKLVCLDLPTFVFCGHRFKHHSLDNSQFFKCYKGSFPWWNSNPDNSKGRSLAFKHDAPRFLTLWTIISAPYCFWNLLCEWDNDGNVAEETSHPGGARVCRISPNRTMCAHLQCNRPHYVCPLAGFTLSEMVYGVYTHQFTTVLGPIVSPWMRCVS